MASYKVTLVSESEGLNQKNSHPLRVADESFIGKYKNNFLIETDGF